MPRLISDVSDERLASARAASRRRSGDAAASCLAARILRTVSADLQTGLHVRLWDGTGLMLGNLSSGGAPPFTLVFNHPRAVADLVLGSDPLQLAESYFRRGLDIEGDLFAALAMKDQLLAMVSGRRRWRERLALAAAAVRLRALAAAAWGNTAPGRRSTAVREHSRQENRRSISFHYDLSNDFYALWLDRRMVYSCAYFETPDASLDDAQRAKLDLICRKLMLQPGERLLDVGCGWGALVMHAARHYGVHAHGITLSREQWALAKERIERAGLADRASVQLCDYRDLDAQRPYDKIASVGMFEHVGLKNFPAYFGAVHRALKPGGWFLNHGITHDEEGWRRNVATEFINRHVFPDGQLESIGNVQRAMERARFEIVDVESLRRHYALTLRCWVERLERARERAVQLVGEADVRVWHLYMAACALEFEQGGLGVYQVLTRKRAPGLQDQPLTRRRLFGADEAVRQSSQPTQRMGGAAG